LKKFPPEKKGVGGKKIRRVRGGRKYSSMPHSKTQKREEESKIGKNLGKKEEGKKGRPKNLF